MKTVPLPPGLKLRESANFSRILIKFKPPNQVANEESLAVIHIGNTTGLLFLLFLFLQWHVLTPHLILLVKIGITFKSLGEVCKQTTFRNVKRDNCCRENTAFNSLIIAQGRVGVRKGSSLPDFALSLFAPVQFAPRARDQWGLFANNSDQPASTPTPWVSHSLIFICRIGRRQSG